MTGLKEGKSLYLIGGAAVSLAISLISQRRRLDGFGNAAECSIILDRAQLHLVTRKQIAAELKEKRTRMLKDLESGSLQTPQGFRHHKQAHIPQYECSTPSSI